MSRFGGAFCYCILSCCWEHQRPRGEAHLAKSRHLGPARTTENVWRNRELTCQHVDPETELSPGEQSTLEVKMLIFNGSLDQVLEKVLAQRSTLK